MLPFITLDFQLLSSRSACPVKSLHANEEPKGLQCALFLSWPLWLFGSLSKATLIPINSA